MCGIFGVLTPGSPLNLEAAYAGLQALRHRGPDGLGVAIGPATGGTLAFRLNPSLADLYPLAASGADAFLGHRRLAIIDLSTDAYQPMTNEDGRVWIVFNGEIYNHAPMRRELEQRGHVFRTHHSDTEVLLHGYEEWGDQLLDRLNGMFGLAILDLRVGQLLLARDPFGEKPLYVTMSRNAVAFGSELKSLTATGLAGTTISRRGLADFIRFGYVPAPVTILRDVQKLQRGEAVRIDLRQMREIRRWQYWTPSYDPQPVADEREWHEAFAEVLGRAVRARFMSDVPLGAYLSGGLDSSTIVRQLREADLGSRLTFNISFPGTAVDEGPVAAQVAKQYGTQHHTTPITPADLLALLPEFRKVFDEPFADPSALPTFALARATRQHVTVALSGDGGDELLGGYSRYALQLRLARMFDGPLGMVASTLARPLANRWPERLKGRGIAELVGLLPRDRYERAMTNEWLLAQSGVADASELQFSSVWDEHAPSLLRQMCKADLLLYLPEDLMTKVDRTAMVFGLEVRAPFLDRELFDFVGRAPDAILRQGQRTKLPFRRLLEPEIGQALVDRPKQGFSVPLPRWFRHELRDLSTELLESEDAFVASVFPRRVIADLLREHRAGLRNHAARLWLLLSLEMWHQEYAPAARAAELSAGR